MQLMHALKRELSLLAAATAFVIVCALVWGRPFVGIPASSAKVLAKANAPVQLRSQVFQGTVIRKDGQFLLRDNSGQVFGLEDGAQAQAYLGKSVTVTGEINTAANLIRLQHIESNGASDCGTLLECIVQFADSVLKSA